MDIATMQAQEVIEALEALLTAEGLSSRPSAKERDSAPHRVAGGTSHPGWGRGCTDPQGGRDPVPGKTAVRNR